MAQSSAAQKNGIPPLLGRPGGPRQAAGRARPSRGGGAALLRSRRAIDALKLTGDEKTGAQILRRALEVPIRQIADNAGARGSVVVQKIDESKEYAFGFDAEAREYTDLIKAGI